MNLREYLFYNNISVTDLAKKLAISRSHLSKVIHGKIPFGPKLANKIEIITDGKIKANNLLKHN